ncbi:MAG: BrnA antitoxin family protein [Polyangiaceae bacterium]|nr:BrnA antitoxin family protein [Polyangiaceae bacterium]
MRKEYDFSVGRRGPIVPATTGKTRITIRIDDDLLEWFRQQVDAAGGGNYQTMINEALRAYVAGQEEPLEVVVRRVVKEELRKGKPKRQAKPRKAA